VEESDRRLIAYQISYAGPQDMPLAAAPPDRVWMDQTDGFAYHCLPLTMANQAGWLVPSPAGFSVWWDGGNARANVHLRFDPPPGPRALDPFVPVVISAAAPVTAPAEHKDARITSHFGHGTITFALPYLFRTPRGINLWVKGPTNSIKDGIQPLEGIVETDWLPFTFTMNWRLTRRNHLVHFDRGEPMCMIIPVPRGLAESLVPVYLPLDSNKELSHDFDAWDESRRAHNADLAARRPEAVKRSEAVKRAWQRDYVKGLTPSGVRVEEHQTKINLREFVPADAAQAPPPVSSSPLPVGRSGEEEEGSQRLPTDAGDGQ
jgi:hypothetical protein